MNQDEVDLKPSHFNFDTYLPWACYQLDVFTTINITRIQQSDYVGMKTNRIKSKPSKSPNIGLMEKNILGNTLGTNTEIRDMVRITTVYDQTNNLVELKFINNQNIPVAVLKVIGFIVKFQNNLKHVIINKGLTKAAIHELSNWLSFTNITDLCLDNSDITDGNYDSLLDNGALKNLSLSRCNIDDDVMKKIMSKIEYPLPASKTLTILKLSSNKITDVGAKHLAEVLRTNRQLAYLNLSDNIITDDGFIAILDVVQEFPVRNEEMLATKSRYMSYLREKTRVIAQLMKEIQTGSFERTSLKSVRSLKKNSKSGSIITNTSSRKNKVSEPLAIINDETSQSSKISWEDKVKALAENKIGKFVDPFCPNNIHHKDGQEYCYGNNSLAYINLDYNDVSYVSVKRLCNVLIEQKILDRKPRGLLNISINGNCLPANCTEMKTICEILNENLALTSGKQATKKSRMVKSEPSI